jgi:hypothetical protein
VDWKLMGVGAALLLAAGCGGVSERNPRDLAQAGAAGLHASDGGETGAPPVQAGAPPVQAGAPPVQAGAPPVDGGASCFAPPPGCDASEEFIEISDTPSVRLAYGGGDCPAECNGACRISASGQTNCGFVRLSFVACSAPNHGGVCLSTVPGSALYTDAAGKAWEMPSLTGDSAQLDGQPSGGVIDLDLELGISDGSLSRTLAVHAHVCADLVATLRPCI